MAHLDIDDDTRKVPRPRIGEESGAGAVGADIEIFRHQHQLPRMADGGVSIDERDAYGFGVKGGFLGWSCGFLDLAREIAGSELAVCT